MRLGVDKYPGRPVELADAGAQRAKRGPGRLGDVGNLDDAVAYSIGDK